MSLPHTPCIYCGVDLSGGPRAFIKEYSTQERDEKIREMADIILESSNYDSIEDLLSIITDAFDAAEEQDLPEGLGWGQYATNTYVAIGYWDEEGNELPIDGKGWRIPCGRAAQVRRVREIEEFGQWFEAVLIRNGDGGEDETPQHTHVSPESSPTVVICERCFCYLEAWLELDHVPPRHHGFPHDPAPLSFPGELYEIVNLFGGRKNGYCRLTYFDNIDYGGIKGREEQAYLFPGRWRSPSSLQRALEKGLRGADLVPAVMRDVKAWLFMRPDVWPEPATDIVTPCFAELPARPESLGPVIGGLPLDVLLAMCAQLPLKSMLALSATCGILRRFITSPRFMHRVLKESVLNGKLQWMLPLDAMPGEVARAYKTMRLWLPYNSPGKNDSDAGSCPFFCPEFPRLAFVRACWDSDSMMNRKRQWDIARQFASLWWDYRLNGWMDDYMFFNSRELNDWDVDRPQPEHWRVLPLKPKVQVRRSTSGIFSSDEDSE